VRRARRRATSIVGPRGSAPVELEAGVVHVFELDLEGARRASLRFEGEGARGAPAAFELDVDLDRRSPVQVTGNGTAGWAVIATRVGPLLRIEVTP